MRLLAQREELLVLFGGETAAGDEPLAGPLIGERFRYQLRKAIRAPGEALGQLQVD
jgi:hypothetical protein